MARINQPDKNTKGIEGVFRLEGEEKSIRDAVGEERSIWDAIDEIMRHVPEEVLRRLPADGAERHDHYLYGSPGKAPRTS